MPKTVLLTLNLTVPGLGQPRRSSASQDGPTTPEFSRQHQAEEGPDDAEPRPDAEQRRRRRQVRRREHEAVAGRRGRRQIWTL